MLFFALVIIIAHVAAFPPTGTGTCYYLDGTMDEAASACYYLRSVGASMCCYSGESCLSSGLCLNSPAGLVGPNDGGKSIWRRSCSDYTWQDPACIAIAPCKSWILHGQWLNSSRVQTLTWLLFKTSLQLGCSFSIAQMGPIADATEITWTLLAVRTNWEALRIWMALLLQQV